jgi:multidrug efflux system membrane fusion protein
VTLRLFVALLAMASFTGCGDGPAIEAAPKPDPVRPAVIELLSEGSAEGLTFNGVVRSAQRAELAFRQSGKLTTLLVEEGMRVKTGQALAKMETREFDIVLNSAAAELKKAEADYSRGRRIYESSQAIARSDLEQLQTTRDLARNRHSEALRNLDNATIFAPFDGVIAKKLVSNHTQVQANQPVYLLHNPQDLEVTIDIPGKLFLEGRRNSQAIATIEGLEGLRFPLTFKNYASDADPVTQTYEVVMGFSDLQGQNVLPGMGVKVIPVSDDSQEGKMVSVPLNAVVPSNTGEEFVWVVGEDQAVHKRVVTPGTLVGDRVEITSGLNLGERIVTVGGKSLREGMKVRPLGGEDNR